ncbi:MAG: YbdD/YjiX family protein [Acidobacteriia bacterium]|nr:YbdD/YjiX family protein [Terriglobia bacterium]
MRRAPGRTGFSLFSSLARFRHVARAAWRALREWSGDAAYDRYLRVAAAKPGAQPPLTPAEFYLEQLNRRYSRPTRCC